MLQMADKVITPEIWEPDEVLPRDLVILRKFAVLMDEAVAIPGTRRRIGLDAAIGLIPGVGDLIGAIFSGWILLGAVRHRVPLRILTRMFGNVVLDLGIGTIPIIGDLFDLLFRENVGNVDLLIRHRRKGTPPRSYALMTAGMGAFILMLLIFCSLLIGFLVVGLLDFVRGL